MKKTKYYFGQLPTCVNIVSLLTFGLYDVVKKGLSNKGKAWLMPGFFVQVSLWTETYSGHKEVFLIIYVMCKLNETE